MSRRKNRNGRDNDDAAANENIDSVESEVEADAVDDSSEDTPDIEEIVDEVAAEIEVVDDTEVDIEDEYEEHEQMDVDKRDDEIEQDQGFDQQSEPAVAANSGGKGMAGKAMAVSLLALAGTGYNWYDTNSLKSAQSAGSEQAAVDYSGQIASLEQQIQSLTESQEKLSAMSTAATVQTGSDESTAAKSDVAASTDSTEAVAESDGDAEEVAAVDQETEASVGETADSDQVEEVEAAVEESSESMAAETDDQAAEQESEEVASAEQSTETEVAASETSIESEAQATVEETVTEVNDSGSEVMTAASMPSSDEIKQIAIQQVDEVLADAKKRLGLNEVAQLLSIGEQRLSLAGDVAGAQAAFSIAGERLAAISDPITDPVRESIAGNLESLAAVELVDINALTQNLGDLASAVDTLAFKPLETLAAEEQPAEESAIEQTAAETTGTSAETESETLSLEGAGNILKSWSSKLGDTIGEVGSGIAGDLKNMVRIKKTGPMSDVVLVPEQEYFIRENMKLMLGGAQRAVLQSNSGVYQQNIDQTQSLLGEFFDPDNADVQSVSSRLTDLSQVNLEPELPDISNSSVSLSELLKQLASTDSSN